MSDASAVDVSVVIPALDEERDVRRVLEEVVAVLAKTGLRHEVILVDDGSRDRTAEIAGSVPGVVVVRHPQNRGYGAALKTGIRRAQGRHVATIDSDGTLPVGILPALLDRRDDYDMVVAARVRRVKIPLGRRLAKWILRSVAYLLTSVRIPDINSGLRVFPRAQAMRFMAILPSGYSFTTTITLAFLSNDLTVDYVPIDFADDAKRSRIRPVRDMLRFLSLVVRVVTYFNPLRVYLTAAAALLVLGAAYVAWTASRGLGLTDAGVLFPVLAFLVGGIGLLADLIVKRTALPEDPGR